MTVLTMRGLGLAAVLVALAVPTACGGSPASSSGGKVTVQPAQGATGDTSELPSAATLRTYFDGVAKGSVSSLAKAEAAAEPGSAAAGYVTYLGAAAQAVIDSGAEATGPGASAEVSDGGYRFCNGKGSAQDCYRYTDISGADGKVVGFSVNGKPVADRIAVGAGSPAAVTGVEARAQFVAAFEATATDDLFVAVRIEAAVDLSRVHATYGVSGSPSPSSRMAGPPKVRAGATGSYVFAFPKAALGGTLTLTMDGAAGSSGTVVLPVG